MKDLDKIKLVFVGAFTALNTALGALAIPFYFLVAANIFDYITGITASVYRGEKVESYRGYRGIVKKVCMWLLVAIGYIIDYIIINMGEGIGINLNFTCLVSVAVVFWLLANELISMLENIADIGTPLPPFLVTIVKYIKDKTEDISDIENKEV